MKRLLLILLASAILAAGCGQSRNEDAAAGSESASGEQAESTTTTEPVPVTTAPADEVAVTIEFEDGTSVELLHGETNDIAVPTRENQEFIDLLYGGSVPPAFDSTVLSQRIIAAIMDNELSSLGTEVNDDSTAEARELMDQELQQLIGMSGLSADPEGDAVRLFDEVPYLPFIVELRARQVAMSDALAATVPEGSGDPCARHILVETEAEADTILEELGGGAEFATLAGERSIDPSAATNGGDLGCAPPSTYVTEFADAITAATPGEVVGPVQTEFGFHVIIVDRYEVNGDSLAEEAITGGLQAASVTVDERVGTWDPQSLTIVPAG